MLNGLFLVSTDGEILLQKEFLPSKSEWKPDTFIGLLKRNKDLPPSLLVKNLYYLNLCCDEIYIVAVTEDEQASPIIICEYLEKLSELFRNFMGTITASAILSNIGLAYEIVSETNDAGCPKIMEVSKLKPLLCNAVTTPNTRSNDLLSLLPDNLFGVTPKEKRQMSGEASKKPLYSLKSKTEKKTDELYVDLIEKLSVIINCDGSPATCNIMGRLSIKSYLESDAVVSFTFPPCLDLFSQVVCNPLIAQKESSKQFTITAPPGSVELMSYNSSELGKDVSLPFTMYTNVTSNPIEKMLSLSLKIYCDLPIRHPAVNVVGKIPLPSSTQTVSGSSSLKNVTFHRDKSTRSYIFNSPIFPGKSHHVINVRLFLSTWTPVITMEMASVILEFEVPMLCHSDMQISGLKVERANVTSSNKPIDKWVRYLTFSRAYEFRMSDDWFLETSSS